jgi:hypothetical protein
MICKIDKTFDIAPGMLLGLDETNSPAAGKPNSDAIQKKLLKMFYNN